MNARILITLGFRSVLNVKRSIYSKVINLPLELNSYLIVNTLLLNYKEQFFSWFLRKQSLVDDALIEKHKYRVIEKLLSGFLQVVIHNTLEIAVYVFFI